MRPAVIRWLSSLPHNIQSFVEPFAGGASVSLAVAQLDLSENIVLSEIDEELAAFWETVFSDSSLNLSVKISEFLVLRADVRRLLRDPAVDKVDAAFKCLVRNRLQHGGVLAPGAALLKSGESNRGLASRWYPETLIRRIKALQELRPKIQFIHGDAFKVIEQYSCREDAVFFVDPPYTINGNGPGKRLYRHSDVEVSTVFSCLRRAKGSFLLCYHNTAEIRELIAENCFSWVEVEMQSKHHVKRRELLISNRGNLF